MSYYIHNVEDKAVSENLYFVVYNMLMTLADQEFITEWAVLIPDHAYVITIVRSEDACPKTERHIEFAPEDKIFVVTDLGWMSLNQIVKDSANYITSDLMLITPYMHNKKYDPKILERYIANTSVDERIADLQKIHDLLSAAENISQ